MSDEEKLPVPLDELVEFASREWCDEANRYLQEQAALHPEALNGVEWSVTERWRNAPPHLGFADNMAGFWFTISGGRIEVGPGPASEADTEIDGDYNAILPIGWTIYGGDAEIQARAQREYGHLSRDKPVQMKGQFPSHPPLLPFLGGLHDHMALRTVNNPDIEHRIEHYGLRSKVEELADRGFTILESAFTDKMAEELIENHSVGRHWEEMVVHPWVLTLVDQALEDGVVLISPSSGSFSKTALTAIWQLVDDGKSKQKIGNIVVSQGVHYGSGHDQQPQVVYGGGEANLSEYGVSVDEGLIQNNGPIFWSLCGL